MQLLQYDRGQAEETLSDQDSDELHIYKLGRSEEPSMHFRIFYFQKISNFYS